MDVKLPVIRHHCVQTVKDLSFKFVQMYRPVCAFAGYICNDHRFCMMHLGYLVCLTLKRRTKIAADDILIFYFYLSKEIRLHFFM